jgi:hypothetical protein
MGAKQRGLIPLDEEERAKMSGISRATLEEFVYFWENLPCALFRLPCPSPEGEGPMKVLLADENRAFRAFIRQILEVERDVRVKVVGEAADAEWLPETKVIMLSVVDGETYRRAATKHGADAFLPKSAPVSEILSVIRPEARQRLYRKVVNVASIREC